MEDFLAEWNDLLLEPWFSRHWQQFWLAWLDGLFPGNSCLALSHPRQVYLRGNITFWSVCGGGRRKAKPCHVVNLPIFSPQWQLFGAAMPSPKHPHLEVSGEKSRWHSVCLLLPLCKYYFWVGGDYLSLSLNINWSWLSCLVFVITRARRRGAQRSMLVQGSVPVHGACCLWRWFPSLLLSKLLEIYFRRWFFLVLPTPFFFFLPLGGGNGKTALGISDTSDYKLYDERVWD